MNRWLQRRQTRGQFRSADLSHIGETEYRLNWIPLGGYVKMLGQDDLNPNATSEDPRAYNRKSIRQADGDRLGRRDHEHHPGGHWVFCIFS